VAPGTIRALGIRSDSYGGGVDFGKGKLAVRAVQFDWMVFRYAGITDKNNMRANAGLIYRF
jgi:hypothetical protein